MIYLTLASFLWGTSFVAGKYANEFAEPEIVIGFRLIIASVFLAPLILRYWKTIDNHLWLPLIGVSFLTYPVTFLLQFIGLSYTTASSAAIVIGIEPLIIVLLGHFVFCQRLLKKDLVFGVSAFLGVLMVIGTPIEGEFHTTGCLLVFASTLVVALWIHWSKSLMETTSRGCIYANNFIYWCD